MTHLIKLQDGSPALLFYYPETRVLRIADATYEQARQMLEGQVAERDASTEAWGRVVARADGVGEVSLASTRRGI